MSKFLIGVLSLAFITMPVLAADKSKDILPPMTPQTMPKDIPALWATFDSTKEPLETKVLYEYEQDGVTVKMISYVVGTLKGKKIRMGGYLAYPTKAKGKLPGIVQIHGGGQRAMADYALGIAQNGYVVLATNWGGRLMRHQEKGQPAEGKIGTDWSPLDATQKHNGWFANTKPDKYTYDDFDSPRNNNWFLINMANKRAITLLQQLDNVDPEKIGVHGHSMGGKLTVMLAGTDKRVKVAIPSCGGTGGAPKALRARKGNSARPNYRPHPLCDKFIDDNQTLQYITCPILYKGPQNDFNGMVSNLAFNWRTIPAATSVRYSITPHMNHRNGPESGFVDLLMFQEYLKGKYKLPKTPEIKVDLKGDEKGPIITVKPDTSKEIDRVEIYYSQDPNGQFRFNRSAKVKKNGDVYTASAPITSKNLGFFAIANVYYKFPKELNLHGPRWEKNPANLYLLSTNIQKFEIPEVQKANPAVTDETTRMIQESFENDGKPDWYRFSNDRLNTRKIRDPKWRGPIGAKLAIDILDPIGENLIMEFEFNCYTKYGQKLPTGLFYIVVPIKASKEWQTVEIDVKDIKPLKNTRNGMPKDWQTLDHLAIIDILRMNKDGKAIQIKSNPRNGYGRKIRNLKWVGGKYPKTILMNGGGLDLSPEEYEKQFNEQIDVSLEIEKNVDGVKKAKDVTTEPKKTNKPAEGNGKVYLTKEMAAKTKSFWQVMNNKSVKGEKKISIGGKEFDKGLGVHAPSEITFNLDGKYKTFHVVPGPDDAHKGKIEMKILVDGRKVYASGKVTSHSYEAKPLDIPVKDAKELTLIVTDAGDTNGGDHASWADAYLEK